MFAVVSDIHANLAAWEAVLADIRDNGIERILCLGDVVGYGPDPEACLSLARRRCAVRLRGNHDVGAVLEPVGFNRIARDAILWTRERIRPGLFAGMEKRRNWAWLEEAPDRHTEAGCLFVHGSPRDAIMEYVEAGDAADDGFGVGEKIRDIFDRLDGPCFVGHTHRPGVIDKAFVFHSASSIDPAWPLDAGKAVINVGSVGQPRDGDPRACYVTVEEGAVRYRRVAYDVEATVARIQAIPELNDRLAERLRTGT